MVSAAVVDASGSGSKDGLEGKRREYSLDKGKRSWQIQDARDNGIDADRRSLLQRRPSLVAETLLSIVKVAYADGMTEALTVKSRAAAATLAESEPSAPRM